MKKRSFRWYFLLPPVLLAAIFIWAVLGQSGKRPVRLQAYEASAAQTEAEEPEGQRTEQQRTEQQRSELQRTEAAKEDTGAVEAQSEETQAQSSVTLLFAGDIYLSDHVLAAYDRAGGVAGVLDEGLRRTIEEADLFIANEEFPFSDRGTAAADKQFTFRLPPSRIGVLRELGPDLVALANNHVLDYGQEALEDTCQLLDQAGILRVGAGMNLEEAKRAELLEQNGMRIGFLAASRVMPEAGWAAGAAHGGVFPTYDPGPLLEEIRKNRELCDYLVVYVHWGIERKTEPEAYQRELARQYLDAGADLVVGSHPHVLQGIEYYKGKPILYSLGNFVFGSSIPETMAVQVVLSPEEGQPKLTLIPATSSAGYTRALPAEKREAFYQKLEGLSTGITVNSAGEVLLEP